MASELQRIDALKTTYYVDQITPLFHIFTTLIMTTLLMYWGSILLIAPGIVFHEEVFVTRLAQSFQYKNVFVVCLLAITWGHYPCRMAERYVKKEMVPFWIFSFVGIYAGLLDEDYFVFWNIKSGGGFIDFYPLEAPLFWTEVASFVLIVPVLACQCTWMYHTGTLGQFFGSTFLFLSWLWIVDAICTPATSPGPDYFSITMFWIFVCIFSAPGQIHSMLQGLLYGAAVSRFLCVSPLSLFPEGGEVGDFFQQIPGAFGRAGKHTDFMG